VRRVIDVAPCAAALNRRKLLGRIDPDAFHRREIEHDPVIDHGEAGGVVHPAANGQGSAGLAREIDDRDHVGDVGGAHDQHRPLVDHRVVDEARLFVSRVVGGDQLASHLSFEGGGVELFGGHRCHGVSFVGCRRI
jgi:hypothetical protein